jgi:iron complex outermembrane receptor protein
MAVRILVAAAVLLLATPVSVAAQEACDGSRQQASQTSEPTAGGDTIVVMPVETPSRREQRLIDSPVTVSVVQADAIERAPAQGVTDLMRMVPGVNVAQTSARDVNVTVRAATGTLANSTLVLFDNRSIYQDFFGFVMWDFIPVDPLQIEKIEVIRGPASAVWGANAMTGVVNIITKTPRELAREAETRVSIQFGQFDRTRDDQDFDGGGLFAINATHAQAPTKQFAFKLSGGLLTQEAFLRPLGTIRDATTPTPYPPYQNRGTTQPKLDARADYEFENGTQLILSAGIAGTEGIIHSGLGPLDIKSGSTFKYGLVSYERRVLKLRLFVNSLDGESELLLPRDADGQILEPTFENQAYDVEFSNMNSPGTKHYVSYGGNFRGNRFDLSLAPSGSSRVEGGAYIQDEITLSDRVLWTIGGRVDRLGALDHAVWSPRTTLLMKPHPRHAVRMSFNRAFRAPSFINSYLV